MSESILAEFAGQVMYHFTQVRPLLPTYLHLILSAVFPIWVGAHASLHRPVSAKKPPKKSQSEDVRSRPQAEEEETQLAAGFEMSDIVVYPLIAAGMLTGLYYLIKYLEDPQVLSDAINAYMSIFGLFGVASFLSDATETISSYVFPEKYWHQGRVWVVDGSRRLVLPQKMRSADKHPGIRLSPLPGILSNVSVAEKLLWWVRDFAYKPAFIVDMQVLNGKTRKLCPTPSQIFSSMAAIGIIAYFNLVGRPWWLTNLLGFSFTYTAFQMMSPTTMLIGSGLLSALFFYDIYMVFFTPMMITVASKLDIPAKLVFPRPVDEEGKRPYAMLGLGDVVVPGIMIAFALRFDLYMYYLRKQRRIVKEPLPEILSTTALVNPNIRFQKATYTRVTGTWGDRFWLGTHASKLVGGHFPKIYFQAGIVGYVLGLLITLGVMQVFNHGQPALLYLVPCVLGALWSTALIRGEMGIISKYTEDADDARQIGLDSAAILTGEKETPLAKVDNDKGFEKSSEASVIKSDDDKDSVSSQSGSQTNSSEKVIASSENTEASETSPSSIVAGQQNDSSETAISTPQKSETTSSAPLARLLNLTIYLPPPAPKRTVIGANSRVGEEDTRFKDSFVEVDTAEDRLDGEPAGKRRKLA